MKNGHKKNLVDVGMRKKVGKGREDSGERRDCQARVLTKKDTRREVHGEKNQVDIETLYSETRCILKNTFAMWKEAVAPHRP